MEEYLSILEVLISQPLNFKKISYKANIYGVTLKKHLDFLLVHMLIKEHSFEKEETVYAITDIGLAVIKTLKAQEFSEKIYQSILRTHMSKQQVHIYPEMRK
jgi:predicted transcriptional regulator